MSEKRGKARLVNWDFKLQQENIPTAGRTTEYMLCQSAASNFEC